MTKSYYDILGVAVDANDDQIKAAYRKRATILHPDVNKSTNAEDEFRDLQEAYATLSDDDKRREYDAMERRKAASRAKPDEVDVALSTFDIEIQPKVKKKKKKKKKKPEEPKQAAMPRPETSRFEEIPDGYMPPTRIF